MWNISRQQAVGSRQLKEGGARPTGRRLVIFCLLPTACCLLLSACRMDMQDQPRYEVYEASRSFDDGLSSRPLVAGTIPRGYLREDKLYYTGKGGGGAQSGQLNAQPGRAGATSSQTSAPNVQGAWAIIAYVRALQLSQQVPASEVPPEKLRQVQPHGGGGGEHREGGGEQH